MGEDCGAVAKVEGYNYWHILQYESTSEMEAAKQYFESQPDSVYVQEDI